MFTEFCNPMTQKNSIEGICIFHLIRHLCTHCLLEIVYLYVSVLYSDLFAFIIAGKVAILTLPRRIYTLFVRRKRFHYFRTPIDYFSCVFYFSYIYFLSYDIPVFVLFNIHFLSNSLLHPALVSFPLFSLQSPLSFLFFL